MHDATHVGRSRSWKWLVCGLLLLATMLNYMDRMTLSILSDKMLTVFDLNEGHYGKIEAAFAIAFALGALVMGWLADRVNVRWLYPAALLVWSAAGFATGFVQGVVGLIVCRAVLGAAEAGNWPCALRTTQRILPPDERTMGNSILQSGAALGAIFTPPLVLGLIALTGTWRYPFWAVGAMGTFWVGLWFMVVQPRDLALPPAEAPASGSRFDRPTPLQLR